MFFRGEALVFVADFGFLAERFRIDDLARTLYYADTEFGLPAGTGSRPCGRWSAATQ